MKNYIDMILVPSNLTCELEAEIDFAKEERMERNKDLKNTYFSYGINLTINDLKEVIELIDFFGINLFDENKKEFDVYFSKICGEHSTFLIHDEDIVEKYGEDSPSYVSYFMSRLKKRRTDQEQ